MNASISYLQTGTANRHAANVQRSVVLSSSKMFWSGG